MPETLQDILQRLSSEQRSRQTGWRRLRGAIWLDHALWKSGLTLAEFSDVFIHRGRSASNLAAKWKEGSTLPSRTSAIQLERALPGTLELFELPFFELLDNRPAGLGAIGRVLDLYGSESKYGWQWKFPGDPTPMLVVIPDYSPALVARGDFWGLTGIVALVRQAEARSDSWAHLELSKDMYRALPAVLKLPWVRPHADLLIECVEDIRKRMLISMLMFDVDISILMKLTDDPAFEPNRNRRPIDPITRRFVEYEDPILEAKWIPGRVAQAKRSKQQVKARCSPKAI